MYAPKPYAGYLKLIPNEDADMWFDFVKLTRQPDTERFTRAELLQAGMSDQLINKLLAEAKDWQGFQRVSIPGAPEAPAARAPLQRQMSVNALENNIPPEVTGNRRFFRSWVRAVPAKRH
jgi:hypothetical protein